MVVSGIVVAALPIGAVPTGVLPLITPVPLVIPPTFSSSVPPKFEYAVDDTDDDDDDDDDKSIVDM